MKYPDYERAFSSARLNKYLKACDGDTVAALTLYRHNIKLCQKCYGILNIFEIVLRNAINEHYKAVGLGQRAIYNELQAIKDFRFVFLWCREESNCRGGNIGGAANTDDPEGDRGSDWSQCRHGEP